MSYEATIMVLAFAKPILAFGAAASWPVAAIIIAAKFKQPISAVIGRVRKLSAFGAEAEFPALPVQQTDAPPTPLAIADAHASVPSEPPADSVLSPVDARLAAMIESEPLNAAQKLAWAIRVASTNLRLADNERIYRIAYGSQIAFLRHLNVSYSATFDSAQSFFADHADNSIEISAYSFGPWLRFLTNNSLVGIEGEGAGATIQLTPIGQSFLQWMTAMRVPEHKAG